ncbi:MAG: hypothetical protein SPI06_08390 [Terrisporobacter sp.]|uniref:hypothetical protein n=1 Tax=Terrisporobacter sp. TaxID=1965305 RepID=UPI002A91EBF2|nr:hypothetical protein [Terrisporobacter sp.]MDY6153417.1 hypothetical protein [Terrisporobacter sp.]
MKYVIAVIWTSGKIEVIACETLKLAKICFETLKERNDIYFASLHYFEKGISKIN